MPQRKLAVLGGSETRGMRQAHEKLPLHVGRKSANAAGRIFDREQFATQMSLRHIDGIVGVRAILRVGSIRPQADIEQTIPRLAAAIANRHELVQHALVGIPLIGDRHNGTGSIRSQCDHRAPRCAGHRLRNTCHLQLRRLQRLAGKTDVELDLISQSQVQRAPCALVVPGPRAQPVAAIECEYKRGRLQFDGGAIADHAAAVLLSSEGPHPKTRAQRDQRQDKWPLHDIHSASPSSRGRLP